YPIIKDALRRLSATNIVASWQSLKDLKKHLTAKQFGYLQRKIALRAAKQHNIQSATWLANLSEKFQNNETRAWHVRILLLQQQWQQIVTAIQAMPESQQLRSRWMYWQAYALQALNQNTAAELLFEKTASGRGYYSFLSADHLSKAYHMNEKPVERSSLTSLKKEPYIQRAYEWFQLHETNKASREWAQGLRNASRQTWRQALQLAASWGWYERTVQAAARTGAYNALALRFPLAYLNDVQDIAKQTGLQSSLIWGVIRQESVFNANALSHRGARGLMQLMPTTADYISKKSGLGKVDKQDLFLTPINIRLGSLYLKYLLKRFDNQAVLAIAAYNAGPTRVKRWQDQMPVKDMNIWVELIPFNETRRYVQQVMAFTTVYDWRLQQQSTELLAQKNSHHYLNK
ncbi:MAG: transglycosylase SLT domain-containing protein, partial [Mariprofundaceae bacterium]|nr:transglycosylase SLT domain-containing protein [Mariprofundaceae bacterium]